MKGLLAIAAGGALGALGRYAVSGWAHQWLGSGFPYGTLVVNLIGCFLLGLIAHVAQVTDLLPPVLASSLRIGFLGALTTFSTFGYETLRQLEDSQWMPALVNVGANVILGLIAVWAGLVAARGLVGP